MPTLCWRDDLLQRALRIPGSRTIIEDKIQRAVPAVDLSRYDEHPLGTTWGARKSLAAEKAGSETLSRVDIYRRGRIQ